MAITWEVIEESMLYPEGDPIPYTIWKQCSASNKYCMIVGADYPTGYADAISEMRNIVRLARQEFTDQTGLWIEGDPDVAVTHNAVQLDVRFINSI